jgi:hypothetical protein
VNLSQEAELADLRIGVCIQNLECDVPIVPEVPRQVNRRKCALTDLALDFVAAGNRGSNRTDWISHTA